MIPKSNSGSSLYGPSADYKQKYELVFRNDVALSQKFMPAVQVVINAIPLPKHIQDNRGTDLDFKGYDLTVIPDTKLIQVGVRVRRYRFSAYDEFTQDDKERATMTCDLYFLGYTTDDESQLSSYLVFNYKDYEQQRGERLNGPENISCIDRRQNSKHSLVWFNCYRNADIIRHCKIYAKHGKIGWKNSQSIDHKQAIDQLNLF